MTPTSSAKRIAMATAAAAATVWLGAATPAEAQYYGHKGYGHPAPYSHSQPTYVHPKILRKQLEMQKRVIKKYGYQQPNYGYGHGYGYGRPVYRQPRHHYHGYGYGYGAPIHRW